ncbi:MAG: hypothetical protein H7Z75_06875 [Ferruginibacter sp.]|nr:hypothetical protein [Cytophagales bacterium]
MASSLLMGWSCHPRQERSQVPAKDTTVGVVSSEETPDPPPGNAKADEYFDQPPPEANAPGDFARVFAGYLRKNNGDEILISMYLKGENGQLSGKYFYEANRKKEDISLRGSVVGDSLMLEEYDGNRITGRFNGNFMDETVEGSWTSPNNQRRWFFKLHYDDMDYDQRKIIGLKSDDYAEPSGQQ